VAAAEAQGIEPAMAMVGLIRQLGERAKEQDPDFLVVAQNAPELLEDVPAYTDVIDGLGIEDLSFSGEANTEWDEPESGDIPTDPDDQDYLREMIGQYEAAGVPVFCIDYALEPESAAIARENAQAVGCVSFVSQTPLDRLP
jgi:endo-alpha-1,4-polygalactosaminidase (GH114 family)